MAMKQLRCPKGMTKSFGKIYQYPDGSYDLITADRPTFCPKGAWEESREKPQTAPREKKSEPSEEDLERARRRARANVRRLALANEFKWFVTLTIDPKKIDSYDAQAVTKRLGQWLSNRVKRDGLRYVLVPEYHKSGRIHYHGFFSDSVKAVDSGHTDSQGHKIYNLPQWDYGFTTAIQLYGNYHSAVGYVLKYIGKESKKIGGRWYYSGGKLEKPVEKFVDIDSRELYEQYGNQAWMKATPGGVFAGVNGLKGESVCEDWNNWHSGIIMPGSGEPGCLNMPQISPGPRARRLA